MLILTRRDPSDSHVYRSSLFLLSHSDPNTDSLGAESSPSLSNGNFLSPVPHALNRPWCFDPMLCRFLTLPRAPSLDVFSVEMQIPGH
jgi:hypothetical protein